MVEIYQEPPWIPDAGLRLYRLAVLYHERCEWFDRQVCTGPIVDGEIRPATSWEHQLINRHAMNLRDDLYRDCVIELELSRSDWQDEIRRVSEELARERRQTRRIREDDLDVLDYLDHASRPTGVE